MAAIIEIPGPNGPMKAMEVEFDPAVEAWNEYILRDGGKVRLRTQVLKIFRILDEQGKPAYGPDGDPWFYIRHNTLVVGSE